MRILLVDDHKLMRDGIRYTLNLQDKIKVKIDEAEDGDYALGMVDLFDYDIVLMDINMPVLNGIETTKKITKKNKTCKIIALSMHNEDSLIRNMMDAGASGYLLKNTGSEELVKALLTVYGGNNYYSNEVALTLLDTNGEKKAPSSDKSVLTKREAEILKLIAEEWTNEEIADMLHLSKRTVDAHRYNMLTKLNLKNTAGLVKYAIFNGILNKD
ncbi:MAG: response regulator transcription factor [Flavobacteriales bacterium]|nr:response regulator transcription factor [Flavobacteriales bacterium]